VIRSRTQEAKRGSGGRPGIPYNPAFQYDFLAGEIDPVTGGGTTTVSTDADRTYVASTGFVTQNTANNPRFDYSPVTRAIKGLLIEAERTNISLRSQGFSTAAVWVPIAVTVAVGATSPDGTANASKLEENNTVSAHIITQTIVKAASAISYVDTLYMKADERIWGCMTVRDAGGNGNRFFFNLSTGEVGSITVTGLGFTSTAISMTDAGDGWYRCEARYTSTTGTSLIRDFLPTTANTVVSYQGVTGSGIYIWQDDVNAATYGLSAIPTVAAAVAGAKDSISIATGAWLDAAQGTIQLSGITAPGAGTQYFMSLDDGTANERIAIFRNSSNEIHCLIVDGAATVADLNLGVVGNNTPFKVAFAYAANDAAASLNGGAVVTDATVTVPTVTTWNTGQDHAAANQADGHIQSEAYFDERIPDSYLVWLSQ